MLRESFPTHRSNFTASASFLVLVALFSACSLVGAGGGADGARSPITHGARIPSPEGGDEAVAVPSPIVGDAAALAGWSAPAAAVVDSWLSARQAAVNGAEVIHLREGTYGDFSWDVPSIFIRNLPGERVRVTGTFVVQVPDVTLAGVEVSGRFEGRDNGNNATLYRSLLTGNGGVTFNGGGRELVGRLREVHSLHRGPEYSGNPNQWDSSDIVHVNHGASVEIDRSWLSGRTATKGLVQMIHGARDATITNTYLGRGSSGSFSAHDTTRSVLMENVYIDWWPHEVSGIGWGMRTTNVTLRNVTAFRPLFRTAWQESYVDDITIENSTFYDIPEIRRIGTIQFESNTHVSDRFPGNEYRAEKPPPPTWHQPVWWSQLG